MEQHLSFAEFRDTLKADVFNNNHYRTRRNTPTECYNCGGFALSVFHWVTPYMRTDSDFKLFNDDDEYTDDARMAKIMDFYEQNYSDSEIEEAITELDCTYLLRHYPFLQLTTLEECAPSDTVIAYRIFIRFDDEYGQLEDSDFHFLVRYCGVWFEKLGAENITVTHPDLSPTGKWIYNIYTQYTGPILFFKSTEPFKI